MIAHSDLQTFGGEGAQGKAMESVTELTDSDAETLVLGPAVVARPRTRQSLKALEVFSGQGSLSQALVQQGVPVEQVELLHGPENDMSNPNVLHRLVVRARRCEWNYVHLAPPCNTYSVARYPRLRWSPMLVPLWLVEDTRAYIHALIHHIITVHRLRHYATLDATLYDITFLSVRYVTYLVIQTFNHSFRHTCGLVGMYVSVYVFCLYIHRKL